MGRPITTFLSRLLLTLFLLIAPIISHSQSQRGVWLTNVDSEVLDSDQNIDLAVGRCHKAGIKKIYVVVWNKGYTLYPSPLMEATFGRKIAPRFEGRDFLKTIIEAAHKKGIEVHAWFEFGFSSSYQQKDGGHIIRAKPHWAALDSSGQLVSKNDFQWMNAFLPEVQDFMIQMVLEVMDLYDIDGVQGDDRLPALPSTAGYDTCTVSLYKKAHDGSPPPKAYKNSEWVDWRAALLNKFMQRLSISVRAKNPSISLSMAPSIYPWSKAEYLQDWPTWLENDWVDYVIPQIYRYSIADYKKALLENLTFIAPKNKNRFIPGILLKVGDYTPSKQYLEAMIKANRAVGIQDEVFFFYEGLKLHPNFFNHTYVDL